jgi:hypothetical protein
MMFGLYARIAAAAVVAVFLAASHWKAYRTGQDAITAEWQADVAQRTAQALEASEQARKVEQELSAKVRKVSNDYRTARKNLDHLAAASSDGLRNLEAILTAPAVPASSATASSGNHGTGGIERELLGSCAATLARMGQEADRLSLKVVTLQEYVKAIQPQP